MVLPMNLNVNGRNSKVSVVEGGQQRYLGQKHNVGGFT